MNIYLPVLTHLTSFDNEAFLEGRGVVGSAVVIILDDVGVGDSVSLLDTIDDEMFTVSNTTEVKLRNAELLSKIDEKLGSKVAV